MKSVKAAVRREMSLPMNLHSKKLSLSDGNNNLENDSNVNEDLNVKTSI